MSERGVFAVDRGLFEHPMFADESLTEREAWMWLVSEAAWKDRPRRIGSVVVHLRRGQLAASIRFMAEAWGWSKSKVGRFLDRLKTGTMIGHETGHGVSIITICNYDKYQRVSLPEGTIIGTETGTAAGQQRDKREDIEDIERGDGGERAPISQAVEIATDIAVICGHDPKFLPPEWAGAAMRVGQWLNSGWPPAAIIAACQETMARKRDGPPSTINYFEKPIAKFIARQAKPVPKVEIVKGETLHVVQGSSGQNSGRDLTAAARRLASELGENRPGIGGSASGNIIRMLPESGRK